MNYKKIIELLNDYYSTHHETDLLFEELQQMKPEDKHSKDDELRALRLKNAKLMSLFNELNPALKISPAQYFNLIFDTLGEGSQITLTKLADAYYTCIRLDYNGQSYQLGTFEPNMLSVNMKGSTVNGLIRVIPYEKRLMLNKMFSTDKLIVTPFADYTKISHPAFNLTPAEVVNANNCDHPFTDEQLVIFKDKLTKILEESLKNYRSTVLNKLAYREVLAKQNIETLKGEHNAQQLALQTSQSKELEKANALLENVQKVKRLAEEDELFVYLNDGKKNVSPEILAQITNTAEDEKE